MKGVVRYNNVLYKDYDIVTPLSNDGSDSFVICSLDGTYNDVQDILDSFLDYTYKPPKGACIYVAPNCPAPLDDIRHNYSIKRGVDNGDCNVLSTDTGFRNRHTMFFDEVLISPQRHTVYFGDKRKWYNNSGSLQSINIKSEYNDDIYLSVKATSEGFYPLFYNLKEPYISLINHTLTKPCIPVESLEFDNENVITDDMIDILIKTGEAKITTTSLENHRIQLNAFNQSNWRKYPGTMKILFSDILPQRSNQTHYYMISHSSERNKAINNLLNTCRKYNKFASKEDMELGRRLASRLLSIEDGVHFVDPFQLYDKVKSSGLSEDSFKMLYNVVTRVKPNEYKEE